MSFSQPRNMVKEKFARYELFVSNEVRIVNAPAIAPLTASAGYDSLYVDLEHSPISLQAMSDICIAAMAADITPLVRVPSIGSGLVSRVLDGGALGIIAPHVESAEAARELVRLVKFPPLGNRSEGGPMPHFAYRNPSVTETHRMLNDATCVAIMVESGAALEKLDELASVPGVDMIISATKHRADIAAELSKMVRSGETAGV